MTDDVTYAPQVRSVGLDGVLVTFGERATDGANRAAIAFRSAVEAEGWDCVSESSSTLVSAFFRIDLSMYRFEDLVERLNDLLARQDWTKAKLPSGRTLWTVPAVFDDARAPQLSEAAETAGIDVADAIRDLTTTRLRVLTLGFAPGQPYLGTLNEAWDIPRQHQLTPNVPKGAIVAAVRQLCLFAKDTPTGWRHVGQTAFSCFRPEADTPFPLSPGDEIQFTETSQVEFERIETLVTDGSGGAVQETLG